MPKKKETRLPEKTGNRPQLPLRWRVFSEAYAETLDWREAKELSGVSAATMSEAFATPGVSEYVGHLIELRLKATGKSKEWVLDRLVALYEDAHKKGKYTAALGALDALRKSIENAGHGAGAGNVTYVTFGENSIVAGGPPKSEEDEILEAVFDERASGVSESEVPEKDVGRIAGLEFVQRSPTPRQKGLQAKKKKASAEEN